MERMTFAVELCAAIRHWGWRHGVMAAILGNLTFASGQRRDGLECTFFFFFFFFFYFFFFFFLFFFSRPRGGSRVRRAEMLNLWHRRPWPALPAPSVQSPDRNGLAHRNSPTASSLSSNVKVTSPLHSPEPVQPISARSLRLLGFVSSRPCLGYGGPRLAFAVLAGL